MNRHGHWGCVVVALLAAGCGESGPVSLGAHDDGATPGLTPVADAATPTASTTDGAAPAPQLPGLPDGGASRDAGRADAAPGAADASASAEARGVFVAVGYGGRRVRSTDDGLTWMDDVALTPSGGDHDTLLRTVTFGNGTFVAAGWRIMTSSDGSAGSWVDHPPGGGLTLSNWVGAAAWGQSLFAAVGGYGLRSSSPDAVTWANDGIDTTASHAHGCLVFTSAPSPRFLACNDAGQRSYSLDGKQWTYATGAEDTPTGTSALAALAAGGGAVVASDGSNVARSSDGGQTWARAAGLDTPAGGLVYAQGHFTLLGTDAVFTSTDGASWTKHASPGVTPAPVAYGHGTFVALTGSSRRRSHDGVTWDPPLSDPSSQTNALEWITFGPTGAP